VDRIKFDVRDDIRFEHADEQGQELAKRLFEFLIKDDFLPIYTHQNYSKMFKDSQISMEMSPKKQSKMGKSSIMSSGSPMRESQVSRSSKMSIATEAKGSPTKGTATIDMHKRTGDEVK
jgi:hypothetical protein